MKELKCPKCGSVFSVDEADYALILSQVKNREFDEEIKRRLTELHQQHLAEQKAAEVQLEKDHQAALNKKDQELSRKEAEMAKIVAEMDKTISELRARIAQSDSRQQLAVMEIKQKAQAVLSQKDTEIAKLKADAEVKTAEAASSLAVLREQYEGKLKSAQEQVEYYKDLKARLSTKMVGETLEIHCSTEFDRVRPLFPNAYFEKDNDASGGSKGDFIFRDYDEDMEYISIMFEMKNEMDETATKHKNEDFFKKLDADRNAKKCEFAVLVSLLEPES